MQRTNDNRKLQKNTEPVIQIYPVLTANVHYNKTLEKAILGSCLLEKPTFSRTYGVITVENFYDPYHQIVYRSLQEMFEQGIPIDLITAFDYIMRNKGITDFAGESVAYFLSMLTSGVCSSAHLEYHCHILLSMHIERELIHLTHGGLDKQGSAAECIDHLLEKLSSLRQNTSIHDIADMSTLMVNLYKHQDNMQLTGGIGIETGFYGLDKQNGGFHGGELIVLGARPSVGKSAFVGKLALNMAAKGTPIGIMSMEMNNNEIAGRLAAIDTDLDFDATYRGLYKDENDRQRMLEIISHRTANYPIYISDKTSMDINEIRAKAEKMKRVYGVKCLIIDYLQLVDTPYYANRNRENAIAELSRKCKIMAKEMDIPVIVLCQLNREVTKRKGKDRYPQLSDLRESGAIEQDADIVMFLHRDWMSGHEKNEDGSSTEFEADLAIRKWRNGNANFIMKLDFEPRKMKFTERKGEIFRIAAATPVHLMANAINHSDEEAPF